jgi:hypothetical protein
MLWVVRTLLHDFKSLIAGIPVFIRFTREAEDIQVSISSFSTASHAVSKGHECTYEIVLANTTSVDRFQKLLIDIYAKDRPVHPEGHHAYFMKSCLITKRGSTILRFTYDWNDAASFYLDSVRLAPDMSWQGARTTEEKYLIRAVLFDINERPCEELTLVQSLSV